MLMKWYDVLLIVIIFIATISGSIGVYISMKDDINGEKK